jgi:Na+/melibiose symporter-like transporter
MELLKYLLSFFLGALAVYLYYKNLWCYTKIRTKREKVKVKYGENSKWFLYLRKRFSTRWCNLIFRLLLFLVFATFTLRVFGKEAFLAFIVAVVVGNLTLFVLGFKKSSTGVKGKEEKTGGGETF